MNYYEFIGMTFVYGAVTFIGSYAFWLLASATYWSFINRDEIINLKRKYEEIACEMSKVRHEYSVISKNVKKSNFENELRLTKGGLIGLAAQKENGQGFEFDQSFAGHSPSFAEPRIGRDSKSRQKTLRKK